MQLTRIRHPFINQDEGRTVFVHQFAQYITGTRRLFVIGFDSFVRLLRLFRAASGIPELPSQLAPKRTHYRSISLGDWIAGGNLISHKHDAIYRWQLRYLSVF